MNKELYETFAVIVKNRSLTKTAEALFVSQSAVSNRLAALEQELGMPLVERGQGQKELRLTKRGEEYYEFVKRYLEVDQQVRDWQSGSFVEVLHVSSVSSMCDYILNGFLYKMLEQRDISVTFSTHWTDVIIQMLENRETDIGLTPRFFFSKSVWATPVFDEPLYLVSDTRYSDYPSTVDFRTLQRANEVHFDWGHRYMDWHDRQLESLQIPLAVTDTPQLIPKLLQIRDSFCVITEGLYRFYNDPHLRLSHITPTPPPRTCYLLRNKEQRPAKAELLARFDAEFRHYIAGLAGVVPRRE